MFNVVLFQPEIPHNAGAILRLCAATGAVLHLVGPLGFRLDAAGVRRAGMDYAQWAAVRRHDDWAAFTAARNSGPRLVGLSTHGAVRHDVFSFGPGDYLLFGAEGAGLPEEIKQPLAQAGCLLRLPMVARARSLNLAQSAAVVLYEALRQNHFQGLS